MDKLIELEKALYRKLLNINTDIRLSRKQHEPITDLKATKKLIDQTLSKVKKINNHLVVCSEKEIESIYKEAFLIYQNH